MKSPPDIMFIVGARPQFIKFKPVYEAVKRAGLGAYLLHSGQHYDDEMSRIFFEQLGLPEPDTNLNVSEPTPGLMVGRMLAGVETLIRRVRPRMCVVFGDTNTTLAGALASRMAGVALAHIESGLRSRDMSMPEEQNRVIADRISDLLFCPTRLAVANLRQEGLRKNVYNVGDVMFDAVLEFKRRAGEVADPLEKFRVRPKEYYLLTLHRQENVDRPERLAFLLDQFRALESPIVFPIHPRTAKLLKKSCGDASPGRCLEKINPRFICSEPLGYLEMLALTANAAFVFTDSGGLQKEAYFLKTPCITLRDRTEWEETVEAKWNFLLLPGNTVQDILSEFEAPKTHGNFFGDGRAALKISRIMAELLR